MIDLDILNFTVDADGVAHLETDPPILTEEDEFLAMLDTELRGPAGSLPICHQECIGGLFCRRLPTIQLEMKVVHVKAGPRRFRDDWGVKQDKDGTITLYKRDLVNPEDLDD